MKNRQFIRNGFPLCNRMWCNVSSKVTKEDVIGNINANLKKIEIPGKLGVNLMLKEISPAAFRNLEEILKSIYSIKVGYEKNYPVLAVYAQAEEISHELLDLINAYDKYRPGITLYMTVTDQILAPCDSLNALMDKAQALVEKYKYCYELALTTKIYLLINEHMDLLERVLDFSKIIYTYDTALDMEIPVLQISPAIEAEKVIPYLPLLLPYIESEQSLDVLDTQCGIITLLLRAKVNRQLPADIIPLFSCGVGQSECFFSGEKEKSLCLYCKNSEIRSEYYAICENCAQVALCTGCHAALELKATDCPYKRILDAFELKMKAV